MAGVALEVPLIALTVWVARLGVGDPEVGFMKIMRLTAVFAGIAALLTAGGIGRLAANVSVDKDRRAAVIAAARAHAIASAGLVVIAAIPHGVDFTAWRWLVLPGAGLVAGAICGGVIGSVCTGATTVGLADVWSVTMRPTKTSIDALRSLLSPSDLARLGTALRTRTTTLFEGIFEPTPKDPPKGDDPKP